jgi:hypothetical protein
MPLERLIEGDINLYRRKELEVSGWICVDVDRVKRSVVSRPSLLRQVFATATLAINPAGLDRHVVGGCLFSEPNGRHKVMCDVELTLSTLNRTDFGPPQANIALGYLAGLDLDPVKAVNMLVEIAGADVQRELKNESIHDFDKAILPRFRDQIIEYFQRIHLYADVTVEWEGYGQRPSFNMDDIVAPFRIPGVARRLETRLHCEVVSDPQLKAVVACLQPDKALLARVVNEAVAAFFDDATLFERILRNRRAVEQTCESFINKRLWEYGHRLRGFALPEPRGLPERPASQIEVEVETPIQLSDSERPVPLRHTAQLVLADFGKFVGESLDRAVDPKDYAIKTIQGAAARKLQGKTFVDLVQAFVLDPLNAERNKEQPKLTLGKEFNTEIKEKLSAIGYDIYHLATAPKAKLVELLIQVPNITLTKKEYQLKGGSQVNIAIGFSGSITSLDQIRGRMTLETDPIADMQTDLPATVQRVMGDVNPFNYDTGMPLGVSGDNWMQRLEREITARLKEAYGFRIHSMQINGQESVPRSYLRALQAGGGHSFNIDNLAQGAGASLVGLTLRVTYLVKEPRYTNAIANGSEPSTYERYIETSLYAFDVSEVHARIEAAVTSQLNHILNQLNRDQIQVLLAVGRSGPNAEMRRHYQSLVDRAEAFVAKSFGLIIELDIVVDNDDPMKMKPIAANSHLENFKDRLALARDWQRASANAARLALERYHDAVLKFDPITSDENDRKALEHLKEIAQQLAEEAHLGRGNGPEHDTPSFPEAAKPALLSQIFASDGENSQKLALQNQSGSALKTDRIDQSSSEVAGDDAGSVASGPTDQKEKHE